jgi:2-oxoisovalerate dehydrogenase E2 component (dihydrolipoyl transacylase)
MKYFKLPDLAEGLTEAEIVSWHVKPGDTIAVDQILVTVETAKAVVEIPSPVAGTVAAIFGAEGELVRVGAPLVEYAETATEKRESASVVGELTTETEPSEDHFVIGYGGGTKTQDTAKFVGEPIRGVRRTMAKTIAEAVRQVARVTIHEDADIHDWQSADTTIRLIRAIAAGVKAEPLLNSWFNAQAMTLKTHTHIDLGIAVDTPDGLFVPVLRGIENRAASDLRQGLDRLRADVKSRKIPPQELIGATIALSNFGTIAGRYADPIVVPPMVCIVGAGKSREQMVVHSGKGEIRRILPLSLSFDHRVITGGEAARFLAAMLADLR